MGKLSRWVSKAKGETSNGFTPSKTRGSDRTQESPQICPTCTKCFKDMLKLEKSDRYGGKRYITYHANFNQLEQSASQGCDMCRLVYQSMLMELGKYEYRSQPGPLHTNKESILLEQDQFGSSNFSVFLCLGDFTLELLDVPHPSELASEAGPSSRTSEPEPMQVKGVVGLDQHTTPFFEMLQYWLDGCCEKHAMCAPMPFSEPGHKDTNVLEDTAPGFLPTRLLAISGSYKQPDIRLVLSSDIRGAEVPNIECQNNHIQYTTLSYKWGDKHAWGSGMLQVTTTPSNYDSHLKSIDFNSLPATFRHAIWVTFRLGINYLWIDALCIIQPTPTDSSDWDKEASTMGDIYLHSTLNIAATASQSVFEGLFFEREAMRYGVQPVRVDQLSKVYKDKFPLWVNPRPANFNTLVEDSPLATRGWVMQERFLAPRTVHFAKQCVFWSCRQLTASEYNRDGKIEEGHYDHGFEWLNWERLLRQGFTSDAWRLVVKRYSRLQLTQPTDRLPAIAGLAKLWQRMSGNEYLAGVWRADLIKSLSWKTEIIEIDWANVKLKHSRVAGTPSWSWASVTSEIEFAQDEVTEYTWLINIVNVDMQFRSHNMLGQVLSGRLRIEGVSKTFHFTRSALSVTIDYKMSMVEGDEGLTDEGDQISHLFRLSLDEPALGLEWLDRKGEDSFSIKCLRMGMSRRRHREERGKIEGTHEQIYLALMPVDGSEGKQYRRVGRFDRNVICHAEEDSKDCDALDMDGELEEIEIV